MTTVAAQQPKPTLELFDAAVAAGNVTICPPAMAAGHMPLARKKRKKRRGERIRPCVRCDQPVRYIKGSWASHGSCRQAWHWVNEDGSHHRCKDFAGMADDAIAPPGEALWQSELGRRFSNLMETD